MSNNRGNNGRDNDRRDDDRRDNDRNDWGRNDNDRNDWGRNGWDRDDNRGYDGRGQGGGRNGGACFDDDKIKQATNHKMTLPSFNVSLDVLTMLPSWFVPISQGRRQAGASSRLRLFLTA